MAAATQGLGTGITITFAGFTAEVVGVSRNGQTVSVENATHMSSTIQEKIVGSIPDEGEVEIEINYHPDQESPAPGTAGTLTITFPIPAGQSVAPDISGAAALTSKSAAMQVEEKMTGSVTFTWTGAVTVTASVT